MRFHPTGPFLSTKPDGYSGFVFISNLVHRCPYAVGNS